MPLVNLKSNLSQIKETKSTPLKVGKTGFGLPYVKTIVDSEKTPSPVEILHTDTTSRTGRFPLAEYYAQAKGSGRLSARQSSNLFFKEPFIIRDIGDRWGKYDSFGLGDSKFGNTLEGVLRFGAGLVDSIGGAVLGRTPSEYVGNAIAGLERTGKFLLTPQGVSFLAKQSALMQRNKQEFRTDARYGLTSNLLKLSENPRKYNFLSLGSLPGVTLINITRPDPNLVVGPYLNTIASLISDGALSLAQSVGSRIIGLGGAAVDLVGGLVGGALSKLGGKFKIPGRKIFSDINVPTPNLGVLKAGAKQVHEAAKRIADIGIDAKSHISKKTSLAIPNAKILSEVGVDKVNMIPYGKRDKSKPWTIAAEYKGKTEEELDFIPFRFEDMSGNLIVFRAILSAITDTFTPNYAEQKYIGRPDKVYVYTGTDRLVSFTFDIYPKSDQELVRLWEKMNYLAGLTYPSWAPAAGGGAGMVAPFCKLTIGDMFKDTPGYISGLTYTVQDTGTWETVFAKLPKYIQAQCTFVYIGKRLPSSTQKQYEVPWIAEEKYSSRGSNSLVNMLSGTAVDLVGLGKQTEDAKQAIKAIKRIPGF